MMPTRSAIVTGSGQGIGSTIARRLAHDGWHVWCADLAESSVTAVVSAIRNDGGEADAIAGDVGDPRSVSDMWATVRSSGAAVSGLVNNAGIFPRAPAIDIDFAEWNRVLAVNLTGGFLMAQEFARQIDGSAGAIVNIASGQAYRPIPLGAHYAASKAGVVNLVRVLAAEWGPRGIRVNAVVPGVVDTAQPRAVMGDEDFARAAATNPLGRLTRAEDVAATVAFLFSEEAAFITGQSIAVNGGAMML